MMNQNNCKTLNFHGFNAYVNKDIGVAPYFTSLILHRIHKKMATNIAIVGEPGAGKSYLAMDLCRVVEGRTKTGHDRFSIKQVVFTYKQFMDLVLKLKPGKPIVFDEPSYSMSHRKWYDALNQALVATLESMRFKMHPFILPIVNVGLLDKTIRTHLLQFQVVVSDRGKATVYRLKPSHFQDKMYFRHVCNLDYGLFDSHKCDRLSCLDCDKLLEKNEAGRYVCKIFRARYERKKGLVQDARYESAKDMAEHIETTQLSMKQIEGLSMQIKDKWFIDSHIEVQALRIALEDEYGVRISNNKAYNLKKRLELHHPEVAEAD